MDPDEPAQCIEIYDNYDASLSPQPGGETFWVCEDPNAICDIDEDGENGVCLAISSPDMLYYSLMFDAECARSIYDDAPEDEVPNYWDCAW